MSIDIEYKMNKIEVSIIVPVYNCEKYIKRCVESLIAQTEKNIQIIIVDDGSDDGTERILMNYAYSFRNFELLSLEHAGVSIARNRGVELAKGEYLTFVDADDSVSPDYIEKLLTVAKKNDSDMVFCGYCVIDEEDKIVKRVCPRGYVSKGNEEWAYRICSTWGRLYRRQFWLDNELAYVYEENARAEDVPISLYANGMAKNIGCVEEDLYKYRMHVDSAMGKARNQEVFGFPYVAIKNVKLKIEQQKMENSASLFWVGFVKFLAHYEVLLWRSKDKTKKQIYHDFCEKLFNEEEKKQIKRYWNSSKMICDFSIKQKVAIQLFVWKNFK